LSVSLSDKDALLEREKDVATMYQQRLKDSDGKLRKVAQDIVGFPLNLKAFWLTAKQELVKFVCVLIDGDCMNVRVDRP